jgi:hypothetical protein
MSCQPSQLRMPLLEEDGSKEELPAAARPLPDHNSVPARASLGYMETLMRLHGYQQAALPTEPPPAYHKSPAMAGRLQHVCPTRILPSPTDADHHPYDEH